MISSFSGAYEFLSNFYPCKICLYNREYPTAEHAFQAMKCVYELDRERIAACPTPADAKHLGKQIKMRADWNKIRVDVMHGILVQKFSHTELAAKLLATGDEELVEGNTWHDTFWGVCDGVGENMLGKLLMKVRNELRHRSFFRR